MTATVPGYGVKLDVVGDDFEDAAWRYQKNGPKASENIDGQIREQIGISNNERIFESTYRGHPDVVERVATPAGGIPGSRGALLMQSLATGVPGRTSGKQQQDDLMVNVYGVLGHAIGPDESPSCTVRVYLPPWKQWEKRSGSSFGFRLDCEAFGNAPVEGLLMTRKKDGWHEYWPGMFVELHRKEDGYQSTHAQLILRADEKGQDFPGPILARPGWYTLGMSVTSNGQVHYFARQGVGELSVGDKIASQFPYGLACRRFNLAFFNVVNVDDGKTWSTPWVIDDPTVYFVPAGWTDADITRARVRQDAGQGRRVIQTSAQSTLDRGRAMAPQLRHNPFARRR